MAGSPEAGRDGSVWRPYHDEPLLTPAMTGGPGACPPWEAVRLRRYLEALITARTAPVHTAVAFNAVYFGFDTATGGYVGGPLDFADFAPVATGDRVDALPVGAMITVRTNGDLVPAEVVYKEGAHALLGTDGDMPGWLSGAPAAAQGPGLLAPDPEPCLRERLVFDTGAFGRALSAPAERLSRLSRRGAIDAFGHLLVESRYTGPQAEMDDTAFYVEHLLGPGRDVLLSPLVPAPLPFLLPRGSGLSSLRSALTGLVETVREALEALPGVRVWGDYAFSRSSMAARLQNRGPLGRDDLEHVALSIARSGVPRPMRHGTGQAGAAYTAIGPALRSLAHARDLLRGTAYPLAVCHANTVVADYTRGESDETTGLLPNGVRLTLDDPWQGGGVWRALSDESVDAAPGTGWRSSLTHGAGRPARPVWLPDDSEVGAPLLPSGQEGRAWIQPLRSVHLRDGLLPVPPDLMEDMPSGSLRVRLRHSGPTEQDTGTSHGVHLQLKAGGVARIGWPDDFFPGIRLSCVWEPGTGLITAATQPLAEPLSVDGRPVRHRYDRHVLTRDGHIPADTYVMIAVRRFGYLDAYGRAMLARQHLPEAVRLAMPDIRRPPVPLDETVGQLIADGLLTIERGSRGADGRPHYPPRSREPLLDLLCYRPQIQYPQSAPRPGDTQAGSGAVVRRHRVPGFLRLIGHLGHEASEEQRRLFREDHDAFGLAGSSELPPGYTYVRPHHRGSARPAQAAPPLENV
ncbi:hypothetical protein [Streptomyces sp. NPDC049881]|uniref:hypothetical protein n=1 Tax=Streptomyces sp. NPDC049881 TaxID=3155778 RepID=UPI00341B3436